MKIVRLETFLTNAGLRNYLFVRLTADTGLTGIGEASLEWQEQNGATLIHQRPEEYADRARAAVARGYRALKFDPFGTAWKEMSRAEMDQAEALVAAVREV